MVHIRTAEELCRDAEAIVVAVARRYEMPTVYSEDGNVIPGRIEFAVREVVKGEVESDTLSIEGELTSRNDYNDRRPPHDFVRPDGRRGDCFARRYRGGARFLLFLAERDGEPTPYWSGLAATNEQLRWRGEDPWLEWTRSCVGAL